MKSRYSIRDASSPIAAVIKTLVGVAGQSSSHGPISSDTGRDGRKPHAGSHERFHRFAGPAGAGPGRLYPRGLRACQPILSLSGHTSGHDVTVITAAILTFDAVDRRICSGLGVSLCLGISLFKCSGISFLDAGCLRYVSFTGRANYLHMRCIIMGFTVSSSLRGAAVVLLALAVAGVSSDCSPSATSFDFVRLSPPCPFSLILLALTLARSSLVVALLAWHWQQD